MRTRLARLLLAAARRLDHDGSVVPQGATRTVEVQPWRIEWRDPVPRTHAEVVDAHMKAAQDSINAALARRDRFLR